MIFEYYGGDGPSRDKLDRFIKLMIFEFVKISPRSCSNSVIGPASSPISWPTRR